MINPTPARPMNPKAAMKQIHRAAPETSGEPPRNPTTAAMTAIVNGAALQHHRIRRPRDDLGA